MGQVDCGSGLGSVGLWHTACTWLRIDARWTDEQACPCLPVAALHCPDGAPAALAAARWPLDHQPVALSVVGWQPKLPLPGGLPRPMPH